MILHASVVKIFIAYSKMNASIFSFTYGLDMHTDVLDLLKRNTVVKKFVGAADKLSGVVLVDKRSEL